MQFDSLPCCAHPTTVLLLDDHIDRGRGFAQQLADLNHRVLLFNHPQAVLDYLQQEYQPQPFNHTWDHTLDFDEATREVVPQLHQQIYSTTRFEQVAVLVTDHDLGCDIDGLQLCRLLPRSLIRTILCTGVLKAEQATEAFNKGLINGYVFVDENPRIEKAVEKLQTLVSMMQHKYFLSLSSFLQKASSSYFAEFKALSDPVFIQFFQDLLQQLNIVEYYLFDYTGCFVMLDAAGHDHALFLRDTSAMIASHDCMELESAPCDIQQQLVANKAMLCLPDIENRFCPPNIKWSAYVQPATELKGKHATYFYHLSTEFVHLKRDQIISFAAYQSQHQPVMTQP